MPQIESSEIAAAVASATRHVFATMLGLEAKAGEAREDTVDADTRDGVVALVGVAGRWSGTGRIYCSPQFACQIASAMLGTKFEAVNEEVLDAVAEVANMIIGNVKTSFEDRLGPLALSIPTVVFGRNYHTQSARVRRGTAVPFQCNGGVMEVRFCLVDSPKNSAPRPALQTA